MSDGWQGGTFSISIDMSANDAAGIPIVSSAFSNQMDVVKAGINDTINKAGQNQPSANLPMGGFRHTQAGAPAAIDQYMRVREFVQSFPIYAVDANAGTSLSLSVQSSFYPASLSAGMWVRVKAAGNKPSASSGTISFHLNSLSANVAYGSETSLWPGAFTSGQVHELIYDGSAWQLQNPGSVWVTKTLGTIKGRLNNGTILSASSLVGVSADKLAEYFDVSVEIRRDGNEGHVRLAKNSENGAWPEGQAGRILYVFSVSADQGPNQLFFDGLPSWVTPSERRWADPILAQISVGDVNAAPVGFATKISSDRVVAQRGFQKAGNSGTVIPFVLVYRLT